MSYFFWRAKAQRRKEIGENLSDLPEVGRLFVNLFFIWRAKVQILKENPFAAWRLCESKFFFLTKARSQPAVGRLGVN